MQLVALAAATTFIRGQPYSQEIWFISGLFALVVNPQLVEVRHPVPGAVLGASLSGLVLVALAHHDRVALGWSAVAVLLALAALVALGALVLGAGRRNGRGVRAGRAASQVVQLASARTIFSAIFAVDLLETFSVSETAFWVLALAWAGILITGAANWQAILATMRAGPVPAHAEGLVAPSRIVMTAPTLPRPGSWVTLSRARLQAEGVVISRVPRANDVWGQVHLVDANDAEAVLAGGTFELRELGAPRASVVGSVDVGSTERQLRFVATSELPVGATVRVPVEGRGREVLYQVSSAHIEELTTRGGSQLAVRVVAPHVGAFNPSNLHLERYRWVPPPGAAVLGDPPAAPDLSKKPASWFLLGNVTGTQVPVFLDLDAMVDGHLAILGMTKMGKTSLAFRLASELSKTRHVVVLDQTGEYRAKRGVPKYVDANDWKTAGVSVHEPGPHAILPDWAFKFLGEVVNLAVPEYDAGAVTPRSLLVDEAHQFVPEPAVIGYNAKGRDSAMYFGLLVMQVRKYGLSLVLVSQRTAVVAKSALSQCENIIAFRSVDQTGLEYLETIAGPEARTLLPNLRQGEALVFGPALSAEAPVVLGIAR